LLTASILQLFSMSDNVVLEEEYDPNYAPTQEEIHEYAEFLGMNAKDSDDVELLWIAEEGLKAPLPSEWKPCKSDEDDIYYFNFDTGESRWEHPCDEYYKKLYQTEKKKQAQQKQQKQQHVALSKIVNDFDSIFQTDLEKILESDTLNADVDDDGDDATTKGTTNNSKAPTLNALKLPPHNKLLKELDAQNSEIPTFHLNLEPIATQMDRVSAEMKTSTSDEQNHDETPQIQTQNENEKESSTSSSTSSSSTSKQQQHIESELEALKASLDRTLREKQTFLTSEHEQKLTTLKQDHNRAQERVQHEHAHELKQLQVQHHDDKNTILQSQRQEIESLKETHEQYLAQMRESMQSDVSALSEKQQSVQQQTEALQSFKQKQQQMEVEHATELETLRCAQQATLEQERSKWEQELRALRAEKEAELQQLQEAMTQSRIDALSEREVSSYKEQYAAEIEQRKEQMKSTLHAQYEHWKHTQQRYYEQQKTEQTQTYERELKLEMDAVQARHRQQLQAMTAQHDQRCADLEREMANEQQTRREQLRSQYEMQYDELMQKLKIKNENIEKNIQVNISRTQNEHTMLQDKLHALETEHECLQNETVQLRQELRQQKIAFSAEKRDLHFDIENYKQKLGHLEQQLRERERQAADKNVSPQPPPPLQGNGRSRDGHADDDDDAEAVRDCNEKQSTISVECCSLSSTPMTMSPNVSILQDTEEWSENNRHQKLPSTVSEWGGYLQKEQEYAHKIGMKINLEKKLVRQKQRKLQMLQSQWKKDRDKLQSMSISQSNKAQISSLKQMLKTKKTELDREINAVNEKVLEIREWTKVLSKKEARLQMLEIEYMRTQSAHQPNNNSANNVSSASETLDSQPSRQSITLVPHPPSTPKCSVPVQKSKYVPEQQQRQQQKQQLQNKSNDENDCFVSNGNQERCMIESHSIGQGVLNAVLSKYVQRSQHTQRTINHHRLWLKSFQDELVNVSNTMSHRKLKTQIMEENNSHRYNNTTRVDCAHENSHSHTENNSGEVVIRVKIEK